MSSLNLLADIFKTKLPSSLLLQIEDFFGLAYSLIVGLFLLALLYTLGKFLLFRRRIGQYVLFEVKPLRETLQSSFSTQQLFNLIHGLVKQQSLLERLLDSPKSYSFEIVSTKKEGIRYLIRIVEEDSELVKKTFLSYLPGLSIKKVSDYVPKNLETKRTARIVDFKLSSHFAYPLKNQKLLKEHDPIAYITGSMTKLAKNELVSFQIVASPVGKRVANDTKKITNLIYSNSDLVISLRELKSRKNLFSAVKFIFNFFVYLMLLPVGFLVFMATEGKEGPFLKLSFAKSKKTSNAYQKELEKMVKEKLDQPLFAASLRLLVVGDGRERMQKRARGFISTLSTFNNLGYQSLVPFLNAKSSLAKRLKAFMFKNRLLGFFGNSVLSASEVSDIYHFPFTSTTKTEDLVKLHSRQLPAPVALKKAASFDVVFAKNTYGGTTTKIGLSLEERRRHIYILGATGTGKSTLLLSMIDQDIRNGKGLCVIDPHGDLIEDTLQCVPKNRVKDVIYFNPDDISYPMGINLLELSEGLNDEDALREKEYVAESIISLFHKIYSEKYSGPRMEYILRNTIHTAFTIPNATLFTVYKLLINTPFRKSVVRNLTDENLKDFWRYEFAKAGDYQKVKMISPITNKIGRFLFSPTAKRILGQEKSTINFSEIIDDGKILLCNLSKGRIGEDNSEVLGVVIMAKLQLAALKRARVKMKDRKDYYLYVDEFQNFATSAFAQILSEARKYRLNAILAHQTTSQIKDKSLVNVTLANTGTVICFRTANPEDEKLISPQFRPFIGQGEIASLPSYHFYMRLGALNPEEPFSGETVLTKIRSNKQAVFEIIQSSRKQFAIRHVEPKPTGKKPIGKVVRKRMASQSIGALP